MDASTLAARASAPAAQERLSWTPDNGWHTMAAQPTASRPCLVCAARGRFTWLTPDDLCPRADVHPGARARD